MNQNSFFRRNIKAGLSISGLFILCVIFLHAPVAFAEDIINWEEFTPAIPLPKAAPHFFTNDIDLARVVDSKSSPVNPFPKFHSSLYVEADAAQDRRMRLWIRAFTDEPKRSGSFEFTFLLVEGGFEFFLGQNKEAYILFNQISYIFNDRFPLRTNFAPESFVRIKGLKLETDSIVELSANQSYTFKIEWNFDSETPGYRFFLNGEPMRVVGNPEEYVYQQEKSTEAQSGVDSLGIISTNTGINKFFLGNFSANALDH